MTEIISEYVGVVGAGQMGSGIAEVFAQHGFDVVLLDSFDGALAKAKDKVNSDMKRLVSKGKWSEIDANDVMRRITYAKDFELLSKNVLVIEAVPEILTLKREIFFNIESNVSDETIIASNASALPISSIISNVSRKERCIGLHFFYPATIMKLVEVIPSFFTNQAVIDKTTELITRAGRTPAMAPETPGFLVNRLLVPMQNEAAYLVMEGAKPEDVDKAMKLGANFPMGPLELTDYVGVDVMYNTMVQLYEGFHDSKYRPCPLLKIMVDSGFLGRKSGKGFYDYAISE